MDKFFKILWIVVKFIFNIVKHVILLPLYCSMSDKYNGTTYEEWLDGKKDKQ